MCVVIEDGTSVDAVVLVEVVDRVKDLANSLGGILLSELALLANTIEELSSGCQLRYNVVLVLQAVRG